MGAGLGLGSTGESFLCFVHSVLGTPLHVPVRGADLHGYRVLQGEAAGPAVPGCNGAAGPGHCVVHLGEDVSVSCVRTLCVLHRQTFIPAGDCEAPAEGH